MMTITQAIQDMKRKLSGSTLKDLKKIAIVDNCSVDSVIWLLTPTYACGLMRSNAYSDCPECVKSDGLVVEFLGSGLNYTPWRFTDKAREIMTPK